MTTTMDFDQGSALLHFARNGAFGPGGRRAARARARRGPVRLRHRTAAATSTASPACSAPRSATPTARRWPPSPARSCSKLAFNTLWGTAHPAGARARRPARRPRARRASTGSSSPRGGSESVEAAWKIVRQYHLANGQPQRLKAIARHIAYHGVTLGALALTGVPGFKEPFGPPGHRHHPRLQHQRVPHRAPGRGADRSACCDEMEQAILDEDPETVAMIIAEPVQNAGGCLVPPPGLLGRPAPPGRPLRDPARRRRGHHRLRPPGRVVRLHRASDAAPDIITTAKGLTSAYAPMGAVFVSEHDRGAAV